jgi:hypothetical protein
MPVDPGSPRRATDAAADRTDASRDEAPRVPPHDDRTAHASDGAPPPDPSAGLTSGMAMVRKAVTFTNAEVLDPTRNLSGTVKPTGMDVGANALADSAGAMMLQDMRSYLQSTEMVLVPVTAAAFTEILAGNSNGETALGQIEKMLGYLTTFSTHVIANAATIQKDFG